jgi:hypothetical protein
MVHGKYLKQKVNFSVFLLSFFLLTLNFKVYLVWKGIKKNRKHGILSTISGNKKWLMVANHRKYVGPKWCWAIYVKAPVLYLTLVLMILIILYYEWGTSDTGMCFRIRKHCFKEIKIVLKDRNNRNPHELVKSQSVLSFLFLSPRTKGW